VLVAAQAAIVPGEDDARAEPFSEGVTPDAFESVSIHPPAASLACLQHEARRSHPMYLGDAAGLDCAVVRRDAGPSGSFPRVFVREGTANEDWFGWRAALHAPFDGVVESLSLAGAINAPGTESQGRGSTIVFRRRDSVRVIYAHVIDVRVAVGDRVIAGQTVARIGNDGTARFPQVHVGAWKGREPLQVRLDPHASGALEDAPEAGSQTDF
jgi:hypothetical protein